MRWLIAELFLCLAVGAAPVSAQTITDGDTLRINGETFRLWGIDAPELKQVCADEWPAGRLATAHLQSLVQGRGIICRRKTTDRYGRIVAICFADGQDLGAAMVRSGFAWAFTRYSADYVGEAAEAQKSGLGVHGHRCVPAWEWRAAQR